MRVAPSSTPARGPFTPRLDGRVRPQRRRRRASRLPARLAPARGLGLDLPRGVLRRRRRAVRPRRLVVAGAALPRPPGRGPARARVGAPLARVRGGRGPGVRRRVRLPARDVRRPTLAPRVRPRPTRRARANARRRPRRRGPARRKRTRFLLRRLLLLLLLLRRGAHLAVRRASARGRVRPLLPPAPRHAGARRARKRQRRRPPRVRVAVPDSPTRRRVCARRRRRRRGRRRRSRAKTRRTVRSIASGPHPPASCSARSAAARR